MQKIPIVIPKRDRKVRSLFFNNSCIAILKPLAIIAKLRRILQIYAMASVPGKILFLW
jgi:hypothetical protein